MSQTLLQVEGLTRFYGSLAAVRNISFEIRQGEVLGFLGSERRRQDHHACRC
ncbi:MAG: hypothetical protein MZV65_52825 [Chromatiales bacterium]|nr:hypothetical protein [Chromatiales bacterium]